ELARGAGAGVEPLPGRVVERFGASGAGGDADGPRVRVVLRSADGATETVAVDRVLSLTGYVGDRSLHRQLQVHECYATEAPMKLAAALLEQDTEDCLAGASPGADTLLNPEPGYFVLGVKSYGRSSTFLLRDGWEQVDQAVRWVREGGG
ncbi:MAG: hypothetical protein ACOC83_05590, partial [Gemmatimonadota bacterium]